MRARRLLMIGLVAVLALMVALPAAAQDVGAEEYPPQVDDDAAELDTEVVAEVGAGSVADAVESASQPEVLGTVLARTGFGTWTAVLLGTALVVSGAFLLLFRRRRPPHEA